MHVSDATWRRSVAGGLLVAVFAGQVQAAEPLPAEEAAGRAEAVPAGAREAGVVAGTEDSPAVGAGTAPAPGRPTMREAAPQKETIEKPARRPLASKRKPRPAARGAGAGLEVPRTAAQWKAENPEFTAMLPAMSAELGRIVQSFARRGELLSSHGCGGSDDDIFADLRFMPTIDTEPTPKAALLERIARAFRADVGGKRNVLLLVRLEVGSSADSSQMALRKHPDRLVTLVDDQGEWTLKIDRADGKPGFRGVVKDHDDGSDVPETYRGDFTSVAVHLESFKQGTKRMDEELPPE